MKSQKPPWVILVLVLLGGVGVIHQSQNVWKLVQAGDRVKQAQLDLDQIQSENDQLKLRLAEVDNPGFIEKEAREKLGYARMGETVYILPDQVSDSRPTKIVETTTSNWRKWWDLYIKW